MSQLKLDLTVRHRRNYFLWTRRAEVTARFTAERGSSIAAAKFAEQYLEVLAKESGRFSLVGYFDPAHTLLENMRGESDELFFAQGKIVPDSDDESAEEEGIPFSYALRTSFVSFVGGSDIQYQIAREIRSDDPLLFESLPPIVLLRSASIEAQLIRISFDLFQPQFRPLMGSVPFVTFSLALEITSNGIALRLAREGVSFKSHEHHDRLLELLDGVLETLGLYRGFMAKLRAERVAE